MGNLVLDRTDLYGSRRGRNGPLASIDFRLIRGGKMREAIIISTIMILTVIMWWPKERKGR